MRLADSRMNVESVPSGNHGTYCFMTTFSVAGMTCRFSETGFEQDSRGPSQDLSYI